ncbi:unnamed protein product [Phyllotreta striolata]|uniref:DUF243 domain-containing protein n=1 Tax=Phyllotreta striolata TaxID=444603 RepID=A0A9N9TNU7_PHYSR|nr:unnamed protein product [Phyllotreta striolata]
MRLPICLTIILATAHARPEPPTGYNYPSPGQPSISQGSPVIEALSQGSGQSSFGSLSQGSGQSSFGSLSQGSGQSSFGSLSQGSGQSSFGSLSQGSGQSSFGSLSQGSGQSSFGSLSQGSGQSSFGSLSQGPGQSSFTSPSQGSHSFDSQSQGGQSSFGSLSQGGQSSFDSLSQGGQSSLGSLLQGGQSSLGSLLQGGQSSFGSLSQEGQSSLGSLSQEGQSLGQTLIHKHVYVHVAPEEPQEVRERRPVAVAAPQKHYKIIFIKAPAPPAPVAPVIPAQPQNEEKTLVYVLVKKPEEAAEIVVPTAAPTQPSKPEVYFIKYDTKKEQATGGHQGYPVEGAPEVVVNKATGGSGSVAGQVGQSNLGSLDVRSGNNNGNLSSKYGPPGYQR